VTENGLLLGIKRAGSEQNKTGPLANMIKIFSFGGFLVNDKDVIIIGFLLTNGTCHYGTFAVYH